MGKQVGPNFYTGHIGGLCHYKVGNAYLVRVSEGPSRDQIMRRPEYARMRENISEFGACSQAGKLLRVHVRRFLKGADRLAYQRVTKLMTVLKNFDVVSVRGERKVSKGLESKEARALVQGFDLNLHAPLKRALRLPYAINSKGEIVLEGLDCQKHVVFPKGAYCVRLKAVRLHVDFDNKFVSEVLYSEALLKKNDRIQKVCLQPMTETKAMGHAFYLLQVEFMSKPGVPVADGKGPVLSILAVEPAAERETAFKGQRGVVLPFEVKRVRGERPVLVEVTEGSGLVGVESG